MDLYNGQITWESDWATVLKQAGDARREILIYFHKPH